MSSNTELAAAARALEDAIADRIRREPDSAGLWQSTTIIAARVRLQRALANVHEEPKP
jgi:hypothetical protein